MRHPSPRRNLLCTAQQFGVLQVPSDSTPISIFGFKMWKKSQKSPHRLPRSWRKEELVAVWTVGMSSPLPVPPRAAAQRGSAAFGCPNLQQEQVPVPVYHPTPSQTRLATQLTEEEQIRIAQRIGLIQHLPKGVYDPGRDGSEKKIRECVICMMDFVYGDPIRFLPCMHIYHLDCIDDWLMRSFTCPSCMEPVDAALLSSYETN
ncbi:PREDICTED: RING finger protein 11 [Mesitornis unicolor]|uniref:RING finger protein 11 n=1 Tax=Mesitornis unicolor TaxID=54374 RepID=UPI000528B1F5|nr:PREDICTED: RING finger protein 11 [Mesitornis unicolor]